jgi:plastocyanin
MIRLPRRIVRACAVLGMSAAGNAANACLTSDAKGAASHAASPGPSLSICPCPPPTSPKPTDLSARVSPAPPLVPLVWPASDNDAPIVDIQMKDFTFVPFEAIVVEGSTVRWTNFDFDAHDTVSELGGWNSGLVNLGESFSFTTDIDNRRTFEYVCTLHGGMTGLLTVVEVPEPVGAMAGAVFATLAILRRRSPGRA